MKRHNIVLSFPGFILLIFFTYTYADAFQADTLPSEINPGDAFVIKITDVKTSQLPVVVLNEKTLYFSNCGESCFVAVGAVGIETKPGNYTIQLSVGEMMKGLNLIVKHTSFPTLSLTLPEDKVFLSPKNLRRVKREDERLKSIWRIASDKLWEGDFILPLRNESQRLKNNISTAFGTKRIINQKKVSVHKGMDIKGKTGEEVKASNRSKVVLAEELFFGGNTIILDHGQGIYTIYMHLSKFNVKPGDIVSKGDIIGFVGSSGRASGPHLHFGVKVLNINTNPVSFVELDL